MLLANKPLRITNYALRFTFYVLLLSIFTFLVPTIAAQESAVPRFEPTECPFPILNGRTVECGYLIVPADHFNPSQETFRLAVSILRSDHPNPLPEPILFLNGGPGDETAFMAGAEGLPLMAESRWDMIFLDQRGIGYSQPNLNCPPPDLPANTVLETTSGNLDILEEVLAVRRTAIESCYQYLLAQSYDLTLFNSQQIAADAAVLRQVLNIESLNIYAFSFGTVPAQLLLRDYPEGIRAVILDSPLPLEIDFQAERPRQAYAAFQGLFEACNRDLACRVAYPDLESLLMEVVESLNEEPVSLSLTDEATGQVVTQQVNGDLLLTYLGSMANSVSGLVRIPSIIYDLSIGDTTQLTNLVGPSMSGSLALDNGMASSVFCHDFMKFGSAEAVYQAADGLPPLYTQAAVANTLFDISICDFWRSDSAVPNLHQPATGQTPTLVLSGQFDFGLPPAWGEMIAGHLENSYFYEIPGVGHSVLGPDCPISMALSFLVDPGTAPPSRCLDSMDPPEFVLSQATSRPWARTAVFLLMGIVMAAVSRSTLPYLRSQGERKRPSFTWLTSLRMINWLPAIAGGVLIALAMLSANSGQYLFDIQALGAGSVLGIILPLIAAVQAAFLFSPEDEPGLEILLATPRPAAWTALERLALVLLAQLAIGLLGTLIGRSITGTGEAFWVSLAHWLVPVIFFSGLGLMITISTRHAVFGLTMSTITWFALALFGDSIIVRWPFLWPLHIFLKPEALTLDDYLLNRSVILALGLLMLVRAVYLLRDEEQVLFGRSPQKTAVANNRSLPGTSFTNILVTPERQTNLGWRLAQVGSIVRAEMRLQWRRRAMSVMALTILAFPVMTALLIDNGSNNVAQSLVEGGIITAAEARERVTNSIAPFTFAPIYVALLMLVPPIAAELIPKDRQLGVWELLGTTPLSLPVYLVGKVLGFCLSALAGLLGIMLVSMLVWRLLLGPFAIMPVLNMWLLGGGSILIINGGLGVLLAAGQGSRRWAALTGFVFAMISIIMFSNAFGASTADFFYLNNLARPAMLDYYMLASLQQAFSGNITSITEYKHVWLTITAGFVQLLLVGLLMWRWLVYRNGR